MYIGRKNNNYYNYKKKKNPLFVQDNKDNIPLPSFPPQKKLSEKN